MTKEEKGKYNKQYNLSHKKEKQEYNKEYYAYKIPCAFFNLTDNQQKKCFYFSNLQPMWHEDNIRKHSLYEGKRYDKWQQILT